MFPFGAPILSRSSLSNIIFANAKVTGVITMQQSGGLLLMAAFGEAFKTLPSGMSHSKAARVPFDAGRS